VAVRGDWEHRQIEGRVWQKMRDKRLEKGKTGSLQDATWTVEMG